VFAQLELPDDVIDELAERVSQRLERSRWAPIEGVAEYLKVDIRRVRDFRERGLPAKKIGRRLLFDLREVDAWLESQ
jgi:excisionase family DNA binding protein